MFEYIDSSGNIITYDQITKMAKEGKTSFDAIVKKNGYKPKPNATKVKSGAELLGIDTATKKNKKEPVKKTVIEDKPVFTSGSDPFAGTDIGQPTKAWSFKDELTKSKKQQKIKTEFTKKKEIEEEAKAKERAARRAIIDANVSKELVDRDTNEVIENTPARPITASMLNFESEEEVSKNLKGIVAMYGLTPIETRAVDKYGIDRMNAITIGNKNGDQVEQILGQRVGSFLSKEERQASADALNDLIEKYGNTNFSEEAKAKYGKINDAITKKAAPPSRTFEQKIKLWNETSINQFKEKEELKRNRLRDNTPYSTKSQKEYIDAIKLNKEDFNNPDEYNQYKIYKETGQMPFPSTEKLEKFIGSENDKARQYGFEKALNDLDPEARVALTAIKNKELIEIKNLPKTGEALKAEGIALDNTIKSIISNKNATPLEKSNAQKQILAYNKKLENFNNLVDKAPNSEKLIVAGLEASKANYNRLEQTATALKKTAVDIAGGVTEIATGLTDLAIVGAQSGTGRSFADLWEAKRSITKRLVLDPIYSVSRDLEKEQSSYQKGVSVDGIKDLDDLGRWAAATTTSMPSSIGMALTGEIALPLFFLSGFGSKSSEIQSQQVDAVSRLQENVDALESGTLSEEQTAAVNAQIKEDKRILNISEGQRLTSSAVGGIAEVVFEKFGSMQILKNTTKSLKAVSKDALYRGIRHNTGVFVKEAAKSIPREGITEGLTQLSNNLGDIYILGDTKKSIWEGVPDATAAGAFMGPGFAAMASAKPMTNAIVSEISTRKEMTDRAKKVKKLRDITNYEDINHDTSIDDLNKLPMSPEARRLAEEIINEFEGEKEEIINRLGKDLSIDQVKEVGDLNQKLRSLAKNFKETMADGSMSESQLKAAKESYEQAWKETVDAREGILGNEDVRKKNNEDYNTKKLQLNAQEGWGIYNLRTTQNRVLEKAQAFGSMSTTRKQDYYSKINIALEEEGKSKLAGDELEIAARDVYVKEKLGEDLDTDIEFAKNLGKELGVTINFEIVDTAEEMLKAAKKIKKNLTKKEIENILGGANGAQLGNTILINRSRAIENGHTSVGSHELLHAITESSFKANEGTANKAGEKLLEYLKESQPDLHAIVSERMKAYEDKDGKPIATNYGEEVLNALSDTFKDGKKPNESALTRISNFLNTLTKGIIGSNPSSLDVASLDSMDGSNIYNLIKDYHSILGGKDSNIKSRFLYSNPIQEEEEEKSTDLKFSKTSKELKAELEDLEENEGDYDPDDFDQQVRNLEDKIKKAIEKEKAGIAPVVKKEVTEEETDKEIIKNEKGSISSDKVQRIYEEKGVNGAQEIIDLFKPITKKLVNKRMDAPGFDRELLTSEIETGDGGLLYLIRSYKSEKGVPLAAYINKQLPLRAIAASRRILDKDFSKDVTEEKGLIAEETVSEVKEKPKYKNALESNVFSPDILKTATNKIVTIVRTLKSRIDAPITLNRTVTPLISEIRDEVGKQLDIDIKTMLGGKKDGVLRKELLRIKKYILENMTTTWLMGKDGQGGIPQAIQKQIDGKWVSFPDWVGQKIDREKTTTDQAGRTSGAELVRRLPNVNNNVSNEDFLAQIIGPDGNPIRGRKESVSKAMAEEGAFDIINADLESQGPIYEALSANQTRLGVEVMENFPAVFQKDSDRGNIKFSKTFNNFDLSQKQYIIDNSIKLASELANINYNLIPDEDDIFKALQKVYNNGTISNENLKELSKDIKGYYTPILAPLLKKQSADYVKNFINASLEENSNKLDYQKNNQLKDAEGKIVDSIGSLFNQQQYIRQAQSFTSKFITHLGKKYNNEELSARLRKIGSFLASQAQIGDDSLTIIDNQLVPQVPRVATDRKTKKEKKKRASDQIYSSKPSFWAAAKYALEAAGVVLEPGFSRNRKGYIEDDSKKLYANRNNAEYLENKKKTAIENQEFLYEILDWYYDPINKVPDIAKAMLWKSLNSSQESPLRKAAIAKWIFNENSGPKDFGDLRYEHLKSVDKTRAQLYKLFSGNLSKQERKNQFADIMEDFNVAVIPISMDKEIAKLGFQIKGIAGDVSEGSRYYNIATAGNEKLYSLINLDPNAEVKTLGDGFVRFSKTYDPQNGINIDAVTNSLTTKYSKSPKGISVFDFDDTVGLTKGSVLYTMPDGSKGKLNAEEFAKEGAKFLEDGAVFDFSEFSKVVDGKPGPMVEKMKKMIGKFGPENFFILTARPADAAGPIHEFLSSIGINIPLENITGLGNSTAQAKADWMVAKAAEGYNDFYFSDDAIQNVKAVENALKVLDVKSKIQQAKLKFSLTMSDDFNRIIEENKGVESYKVFSDITARRRGLKKNRFDLYVPPSAADFELLLYNFMGKGELGEEQKKFFQNALMTPYINGVNMMDAVRQSIKKEYKALLKSFPEVRKDLEKLTPNKDFTYDQAMRVAIWSQYGTEIPGLSQRDVTYLTDLINNDPELAAFKDGLIVMGRQKDGWLPPGTFWDSDTIVSDLYNITEGSGRKKFLAEFIENTENIFGKWEDGRLVGPNMNKVEAVYGTNVREALEDSIYRMINGKNRSFGQDKETTAWSSWVNGSTGAIMFLNTRSAALQMLGAVNFLNWRDNNPFNAGKAFLNQPQYWKDFARIWNSDKLKERRGGLREDVASAEIANAAAGSKNKVVAVTSYLLKIGYTPTQLADSFAIASGGAPFYRNRINSYMKEGLTEQEAESKAWQDFSKVSDETQQSGDPKDISKQQSSAAGRLLLVFQNFTMQQSRIVKKAALDLKNGRGDAKTNISKIAYYLAVQNIMFSTLQQGLFAVLFADDDEEDKEKDKKKKTKEDAAIDIANGVLDSILRGTGFVGGVTATLKNTVVKYLEERAKKQKAEYAKVVLEAANMSPPIGSKLRKTYSALQQTKYDKDLIAERGWGVMQDGRVHLGPMYSVTGKLVEVGTNFPMDRLVNKVENVSQAFNADNTAIQRLGVGLGYSPWTVGIEGTKGDILIKETAKATRKEEGLLKAKETRRENAERLKDSIEGLSPTEIRVYRRKIALEKKERRIQRAKEKREEMRKRRKRRMGE
jgi:hypothetical protein